jgi:hypothetical protein
MGLRSGSGVRRCGALTAATLLEAERAPTARVLCRRAFRNIFSRYVSPLVMRVNNCNQVAIALRGDGDERLMEVWGSQSEQNCQEGLAGLGWRGGRVPSSARANHQTERILLDQSLPSNPTRQQPKSPNCCKAQRVTSTTSAFLDIPHGSDSDRSTPCFDIPIFGVAFAQ